MSVTEFSPKTGRLQDPVSAWNILQTRLSALLRDTTDASFHTRLMRVQAGLLELTDRDADDALLLLVQGAMTEVKDYSVRHAMLVAVVCDLAARHLPGWDAAWRPSLRCAALTMNVAMTHLQSMLVAQETELTAAQRATVDRHAVAGVSLLREAGVTDPLWLGAVEHHHDSPPGPLSGLTPALQIGRLIRRADIFAARLSPRKGRRPMSATAAAKAAYLDEDQQPDEAGSAIIKAAGLYPPGSLVRLRNGEVAVVVRRGARANAPEVACLIDAQGESMPISALRSTQLHAFQVTGGVALHEVNIRLNLERLLTLA